MTPASESEDWTPEIEEIARRRQRAGEHSDPAKVKRQRDTGRLTARERIARLLDEGSFAEIGALAAVAGPDGPMPANFVAGAGRIEGRRVLLGVDDFTGRGGAGDAAVHAKQIFLERYAAELRLPMIRLLDGASGGGSVTLALEAGASYVPINPGWDAVVENLSLVPVVALGLGPTVGLGAARLVMSHLAILVREVGQLFTAGPPVVKAATGEDLTKEQLGGAAVHRANGSVERIAADEAEAFAITRRFLSYLPASVDELAPVIGSDDPVDRREPWLREAIPRNPRRGYRGPELLEAIFDTGSVMAYAEYGGGTLTALARLDGHPVGVIAADPRRGVTLTATGAQAVTRLVDICETFHLPLISLTDQAGVSVGLTAEREASLRAGARAIAAVYQARVPQAEVIVRRVYGVGGAGIVNRHRALRSWAWPSADLGSLPAQGGIEAAFRARLAASEDPAAELAQITEALERVASPFSAAERFFIQDLIDPADTRPLLCEWVHDAWGRLGSMLGPAAFGHRP